MSIGRKRVGKAEWEAIKKLHKGKCVICGKSEKTAGILERAHVKAANKGGSQVVPMCKICHYKFDHKLLTPKQLKKIGLTEKEYVGLIPSKKPPKKGFSWW
jgi:predicted restriction endonuclease